MDIKYIGNIGPASGEGGGSSDGADTSLSNLTNAGKIQAVHLAMPSNTKVALTVSDNTLYQAPADGYLYGLASTTAQFYIYAHNDASEDAVMIVRTSGSSPRVVCPIAKGQWFKFASEGTQVYCVFVYTIGSESEAN